VLAEGARRELKMQQPQAGGSSGGALRRRVQGAGIHEANERRGYGVQETLQNEGASSSPQHAGQNN
jgi:hypothetical protein